MPVKKTKTKVLNTNTNKKAAPRSKRVVATNPPREVRVDPKRFFVIGIGASAGGLEAASAFLGRLTMQGAAFVVIQHLAPDHRSMLTELLGRASSMKVVTVEAGMPLVPDCVYVTPPNAELALLNGVFQILSSDIGERPNLPIDAFFRSLAEEQGTHAIGVVLSGTGTDGTRGLVAIKAAGGITFAQDPTTAKFDGMPRSALESGAADFSLSPESIADEIHRITQHPYLQRPAPHPQFQEQIGKLSVLLKRSSGIDLTHYKPSTIERRIQRRMALHKIERMSDYVRFCQSDEKELSTLRKDLLINVTSFFRDQEPFDVLKKQVFPRILENKKSGDTVRIWASGCSSGEEAYSLAICMLEVEEAAQRHVKVQVFGTDLDPEAVEQARRGLYPASIEADVSPERLSQFFTKRENGGYQVARRLREMVVFSIQNLSSDPPFSRLDFASCRNLLIYLQPAVQQAVIRTLHYALKPDGFLLLGNSETVGEAADLFALVDRKNKIYTAKHIARSPRDLVLRDKPASRNESSQAAPVRAGVSITQLADRQILEQHTPPAVVINSQLEVLYFRGRTDLYLQQPSGGATHHILRLIRPELHLPLKHAVEQAMNSKEPVTKVAARFKTKEGPMLSVSLFVQPLFEPETRALCLLILFKPAERTLRESHTAVSRARSSEGGSQTLKQELALTKDFLHSTIAELERTNEDLKSANEELQSTNEEMQSANEELETSREELQSTNEELITLNDELQNKMRDLSGATDDLHNVLLGVDRAVIIIGTDLRIRRFTKTAEKLINLLPSDIGRSAAVLNAFLGGFGIEELITNAISTVTSLEREALATDQRWYLLRIVPYRTSNLAIRGAVLSVIDIDLSKRRSELTRAVDEYVEEALSAIPHPLMIVDHELTVIWVNEAYYEVFRLLPAEVLRTRIGKVGTGEWAGAELRNRIEGSLASGAPFRDQPVAFTFQVVGRKEVRISGSRIRNVANDTALVLLSIEGDFRTASETP